VRALVEIQDWKEIVVVIDAPTSPEEFVALSDSLYELGRKEDLAALLASPFATKSKDPGVVQCVAIMRGRLRGK
jgi:hypothetical protein